MSDFLKLWAVQGDQMSLCKNRPKCSPADHNYLPNENILPWKKVEQKLGLVLLFSKNCSK
jgi:hypothetical protein